MDPIYLCPGYSRPGNRTARTVRPRLPIPGYPSAIFEIGRGFVLDSVLWNEEKQLARLECPMTRKVNRESRPSHSQVCYALTSDYLFAFAVLELKVLAQVILTRAEDFIRLTCLH